MKEQINIAQDQGENFPAGESPTRIETQFSIFLVNKPGVLAQVLDELAQRKVNIIAMTLMDSVEHGVLRLVTTKPLLVEQALKHLNLQANKSEVLCVTLSNKPGALADVASCLSAAHININYCYVTAGAHGGRTTGVLKVADQKKAMKLLASGKTGILSGRERSSRYPDKQKSHLRPGPQRHGR